MTENLEGSTAQTSYNWKRNSVRHVLTPDPYVGAEAEEDDGEPFDQKMKRLTATQRQRQKEPATLHAVIAANLEELGYGG